MELFSQLELQYTSGYNIWSGDLCRIHSAASCSKIKARPRLVFPCLRQSTPYLLILMAYHKRSYPDAGLFGSNMTHISVTSHSLRIYAPAGKKVEYLLTLHTPFSYRVLQVPCER